MEEKTESLPMEYWIEEYDDNTFFLFCNFHDTLGDFLYSNHNDAPYDFAVGERLFFERNKSRRLEPHEIVKYKLLGYI